MPSIARSRSVQGLLVLGCLLSCVALQGLIPSVAFADAALDDYNLAVGLYKQSRWATAAERFRGFLKTYDKHEKIPLARLYLGLTLVNMEDFRGARDELRLFVKDYPQNTNIPQARYRIAECSYLMEDLPAARTELEAYLKDFPKDPFHDHALPYLADTQLRLNDPAAALVNFKQAIDRFPEGPLVEDAKFGRARALEALKKDDEAMAQFQELVAKPGGTRAADAQFHLGALAFERKKFPEAAAAYVELTKKYPNSRFLAAAHLNAGYAYFQSDNFAEAAAQFEIAANEKSQRVTAGYWQGLSLKSLTQYAKAAEVLGATARLAGEQPLAESILFQQALCERHLGKSAEARQLFETVLSKWSKGDFADDSLHAMAELSIEAGDLTTADQLLTRFAAEFPTSGLRMHSELLAGRLELARAAIGLRDQKPANELAANYEAAAKRFSHVIISSTIPQTKHQGQYYLAFCRQLQGQPAQALELMAPLIEVVRAEGAKSELVDVFILQADALLSEKKYDEADKAAQEYLTLLPEGRQGARALSIQAVCAANRNDVAGMDAALERMKKEFAESPLRAVTTQQLADLAESREDWPVAARLYEALIPLSTGKESQPFAIRGLAWAQFKQMQLAQAAQTYDRVIKEFPNHRLIPECSYYRAEALREAGQLDESIAAFDELMRKVPADKPAEAGAELQGPLLFSYRAGIQAARLHRKARRVADADAEYEELVKRFPKSQRLDQLLDEWALLNYDAERFDRADVIFRRIVQETPDSDLVDNARLSLAESDLLAEKLDAARKTFEELLASDKSDAEVKERSLYQLLVLAVEQQRWADVRQLAERLTTDFPKSRQRWYATYSVAESILANQKATEPELEIARERLTSLRKELENPEVNAFAWYDRVWVLLAELAFRQKKYDELEATVADLRQRPNKSPFLYQAEEVLGRGYKQQAPPKFDEARKAFERVVADPIADRTETAAKSQFLIGETLFLQEQWAEAFLAYQKVVANYKFPEWQSAALLQSGKCDEQQQQWKEAAATYRLLIKDYPKSMHTDDARQRLEAVTKKLPR
ncbi:MAG: tetratricopeptide repeat protein [Planctomycetes bacterium]|nr:tetratricopeptide repeat protein [Planctomycetota bacterium]